MLQISPSEVMMSSWVEFKGDLLCKIHFYMVFEHKYVSAVYVMFSNRQTELGGMFLSMDMHSGFP